METEDGGHDDSKVCSDGAEETESSPVSAITPEDAVDPRDSSDGVDVDVRDLSTSHVEHIPSSAEAARTSLSTDDATSQEADTLQEVSCSAESGSPHHADENTPTEDSTSVKSVNCECHELEGGLESSQVHETQSDAAADKDDDWIYVLGHDQLKKRTLKAGQSDTRPTRGQLVTVRCSGQLDDGTTVDKHDSLELCVGEDDFIPAFDLSITLMNLGEICQVVTVARFAYGPVGRQPDVPFDARITYEIELLSVADRPEFHTMTVSRRIQLSNEKRERGNWLYSREEFSRAVDVYTKAEKVVNTDVESHAESSEEFHQLMDSRVKCCGNLAAAQMKIEAWDASIRSCDFVLRVQPDNVKALFRKGKCLANKGNYDEAVSILQAALKVEPNSRVIQQELLSVQSKCRQQNASERRLFEKMLGTDKQNLAAAAVSSSTSSSISRDYRWLWYVAGAVAAMAVTLSLSAYHYVSD